MIVILGYYTNFSIKEHYLFPNIKTAYYYLISTPNLDWKIYLIKVKSKKYYDGIILKITEEELNQL